MIDTGKNVVGYYALIQIHFISYAAIFKAYLNLFFKSPLLFPTERGNSRGNSVVNNHEKY